MSRFSLKSISSYLPKSLQKGITKSYNEYKGRLHYYASTTIFDKAEAALSKITGDDVLGGRIAGSLVKGFQKGFNQATDTFENYIEKKINHIPVVISNVKSNEANSLHEVVRTPVNLHSDTVRVGLIPKSRHKEISDAHRKRLIANSLANQGVSE